MADLGDFAGSELTESTTIEAVPAGTYDFEVVESAVASTKDGRGKLVNLTLKIISGDFENRKIWTRHNLVNANQMAQDIGRRELSDLSRACGLPSMPADTEEWHGVPFRASVGVEQDKSGQYGPKNVIKRYIPANGTSPAPAPRQNPAPAQRAAPAAMTNGARRGANGERLPAFLNR